MDQHCVDSGQPKRTAQRLSMGRRSLGSVLTRPFRAPCLHRHHGTSSRSISVQCGGVGTILTVSGGRVSVQSGQGRRSEVRGHKERGDEKQMLRSEQQTHRSWGTSVVCKVDGCVHLGRRPTVTVGGRMGAGSGKDGKVEKIDWE